MGLGSREEEALLASALIMLALTGLLLTIRLLGKFSGFDPMFEALVFYLPTLLLVGAYVKLKVKGKLGAKED